MRKTKYYKVLGAGRVACHGGHGKWPEVGTWLEVKGKLVPCNNGLHVCRIDQLLSWLGQEIWEVEVDEAELIDHGDKCVVRRARLIRQTRWNERTARLFAADCAEHVLPLFEEKCPEDKRPRLAIEAARKYAKGRIREEELAAARAAWAAVRRWQAERLQYYLGGKHE